ncbi:MAG: class II aldolase/adducin family protein [Lachnospiraceae bacterium]|nr:class II aldolase/adducin family protein [Lachnospiraceae bacterium]
MANEQEIRQEMCEIGRRVYDRGMVAANDGNFSVKLDNNEFLCTPTGVSKGFMTPEYICKIDAEGRLLEANGDFKPSSEMKMHLRVYKERPDVQAVVHAHPPYATTFAAAGIPLDKPVLSEAILTLGRVPVARYGTPSTREVPDAVAEYLSYYDAMLLANHGALTYGDSLMNAYHKMESVEFYARILYQVQMLGGARELSSEQVGDIYEIRRKSGMAGRHPALFLDNISGIN